MTYLTINGNDYSKYCSSLKVATNHNYSALTNAAGDTRVDYINAKKKLDIQIISLNDTVEKQLATDLNKFKFQVRYLEPQTKGIRTMTCICGTNILEYFWIDNGNGTRFKAANFTLEEL